MKVKTYLGCSSDLEVGRAERDHLDALGPHGYSAGPKSLSFSELPCIPGLEFTNVLNGRALAQHSYDFGFDSQHHCK